MKIIFTLLIVITVNTELYCQSVLKTIHSMNLDQINEFAVTYYSNGYNEVAKRMSRLLSPSRKYFEKELGIFQEFELAILDSNDWMKTTKIPYGLPFVSGPPYIVCIPASTDNELGYVVKKAIRNSNLAESYAETDEELVQLFISLIGFHELGHIYAKSAGIQFPNKWTFEFAATYLAFMYLSETNSREAQIWIDISDKLADQINPKYTLLKDFEKLYVRVGVENYAWYQVVFLLGAAEVKEKLGIKFIEKLRNVELPQDNFALDSLEKIYPGFKKWAMKRKLIK